MIKSRWRRFYDPGTALNLSLLTLVVFTVIWSLNQAGWVERMPSLVFVAGLALLTGFIFSRMSVVPSVILLAVARYLGSFVTIWQTLSIMQGPTLDANIVDLILRINA